MTLRAKISSRATARAAGQALESALSDFLEKQEDATDEGMKAAAEFVMENAVNRTPMRTGALRRSAFVNKASRPNEPPVYQVGYATGDHSPEGSRDPRSYAVFVHERLDQSHPVGEAKFLENAVRETIEDVRRIIADHARKRARR